MSWLGRATAAFIALASAGAMAETQADETVVVSTPEEQAAPAKNVTLMLQGGVEGYSGKVGSRVAPGAVYGVSLGWDPFRWIGGEVGYSGAVNELRSATTGGVSANDGPDLIRNGGYAILKPGWTFPMGSNESSAVRPYVLGGVGVDEYSPQGRTGQYGFTKQTVANIPFGAGVQLRVGSLTADARFDYAYQFRDEFTTTDAHPLRYQGQLRLGAAF